VDGQRVISHSGANTKISIVVRAVLRRGNSSVKDEARQQNRTKPRSVNRLSTWQLDPQNLLCHSNSVYTRPLVRVNKKKSTTERKKKVQETVCVVAVCVNQTKNFQVMFACPGFSCPHAASPLFLLPRPSGNLPPLHQACFRHCTLPLQLESQL